MENYKKEFECWCETEEEKKIIDELFKEINFSDYTWFDNTPKKITIGSITKEIRNDNLPNYVIIFGSKANVNWFGFGCAFMKKKLHLN